jgi:hypothetical protein
MKYSLLLMSSVSLLLLNEVVADDYYSSSRTGYGCPAHRQGRHYRNPNHYSQDRWQSGQGREDRGYRSDWQDNRGWDARGARGWEARGYGPDWQEDRDWNARGQGWREGRHNRSDSGWQNDRSWEVRGNGSDSDGQNDRSWRDRARGWWGGHQHGADSDWQNDRSWEARGAKGREARGNGADSDWQDHRGWSHNRDDDQEGNKDRRYSPKSNPSQRSDTDNPSDEDNESSELSYNDHGYGRSYRDYNQNYGLSYDQNYGYPYSSGSAGYGTSGYGSSGYGAGYYEGDNRPYGYDDSGYIPDYQYQRRYYQSDYNPDYYWHNRRVYGYDRWPDDLNRGYRNYDRYQGANRPYKTYEIDEWDDNFGGYLSYDTSYGNRTGTDTSRSGYGTSGTGTDSSSYSGTGTDTSRSGYGTSGTGTDSSTYRGAGTGTSSYSGTGTDRSGSATSQSSGYSYNHQNLNDKYSSSSDRQLGTHIRQYIQEKYPSFRPSWFILEIDGGNVVLIGQVQSEDEKIRIESLVRNTQGVERVDNQLKVMDTKEISPSFSG